MQIYLVYKVWIIYMSSTKMRLEAAQSQKLKDEVG